jgi:hypothetical protein
MPREADRRTRAANLQNNGKNMDYTGLIVSTLMLIYIAPWAYRCWMKPDEYLNRVHDSRRKIKDSLIYKIYSPWLNVLEQYTIIDLLMARFATLFIVLVCLLMMYVSIFGPFGNKP